MVGREVERGRVEALIAAARNGHGGALLILGDPGIGKTALVDTAQAGATSMAVTRILACDVETAIPYGALERLVSPILAAIDALPVAQRDALQIALGHGDGPPPRASLVGLAVLGLAAQWSARTPVVMLVDDAHLLDAESAEVLGFVARRLGAEAIALIVASRLDDAAQAAFAGVDTLALERLGTRETTDLLRSLIDAPVEIDVEHAIVASTAGNPLAVCEVAREWNTHDLTRVAMGVEPGPIGPRLESHYAALAAGLTHEGRTWLLIAAAEGTGDASAVRTAAGTLGVTDDASAEVEQAGLVSIRDSIRMRHPLVRAAVYSTAPDRDRRAVHAALRDYYVSVGHDEFAVQHAATAASGPDGDIAAALAGLADRAAARGARVTCARLLERAAGLSPRTEQAHEFLIAAAEAAISGGRARLAMEWVADLRRDDLDAELSARLLIVTTQCALFLSQMSGAGAIVHEIVAAADAVRGISAPLERRLLLFAFEVMQVALPADVIRDLRPFGERARLAVGDATDATAQVLAAVAAMILDAYVDAVPVIEAASRTLHALEDEELIAFASTLVVPTLGVWDADAAAALFERAAAGARRVGALRELDAVLWTASTVEMARGRPAAAQALLAQSEEVRHMLGYADALAINPAVLAWSGVPSDTLAQVEGALEAMGFGGVVRIGRTHWSLRQIAEGDYEGAYRGLSDALAAPFLQASYSQIPDAIEAAVRSDHLDEAQSLAGEMTAIATACQRPWALGLAARAAALLATGADAAHHYLESIAHLDRTGMVGERGRSHLLYGEWLRRRGRRLDAAAHLTRALELFVEAGAPVFADRARRGWTHRTRPHEGDGGQ